MDWLEYFHCEKSDLLSQYSSIKEDDILVNRTDKNNVCLVGAKYHFKNNSGYYLRGKNRTIEGGNFQYISKNYYKLKDEKTNWWKKIEKLSDAIRHLRVRNIEIRKGLSVIAKAQNLCKKYPDKTDLLKFATNAIPKEPNGRIDAYWIEFSTLPLLNENLEKVGQKPIEWFDL